MFCRAISLLLQPNIIAFVGVKVMCYEREEHALEKRRERM